MEKLTSEQRLEKEIESLKAYIKSNIETRLVLLRRLYNESRDEIKDLRERYKEQEAAIGDYVREKMVKQ